jgi:hypothetical protein
MIIAQSAPEPAAWSIPGMITKTDEAGVVTDKVRKSTASMPRLRGSGLGCGVSDWSSLSCKASG